MNKKRAESITARLLILMETIIACACFIVHSYGDQAITSPYWLDVINYVLPELCVILGVGIVSIIILTVLAKKAQDIDMTDSNKEERQKSKPRHTPDNARPKQQPNVDTAISSDELEDDIFEDALNSNPVVQNWELYEDKRRPKRQQSAAQPKQHIQRRAATKNPYKNQTAKQRNLSQNNEADAEEELEQVNANTQQQTSTETKTPTKLYDVKKKHNTIPTPGASNTSEEVLEDKNSDESYFGELNSILNNISEERHEPNIHSVEDDIHNATQSDTSKEAVGKGMKDITPSTETSSVTEEADSDISIDDDVKTAPDDTDVIDSFEEDDSEKSEERIEENYDDVPDDVPVFTGDADFTVDEAMFLDKLQTTMDKAEVPEELYSLGHYAKGKVSIYPTKKPNRYGKVIRQWCVTTRSGIVACGETDINKAGKAFAKIIRTEP